MEEEEAGVGLTQADERGLTTCLDLGLVRQLDCQVARTIRIWQENYRHVLVANTNVVFNLFFFTWKGFSCSFEFEEIINRVIGIAESLISRSH